MKKHVCGNFKVTLFFMIEFLGVYSNKTHLVISYTNLISEYLLKPTANWSPYIFTLVQKVKHRVYKIRVF